MHCEDVLDVWSLVEVCVCERDFLLHPQDLKLSSLGGELQFHPLLWESQLK